MSSDEEIEKAEKCLGLKFEDRELLRIALTHRSFAFEANLKSNQINEKLEFLGDAVLNLIITDFIFHRFPQFSEGDLAKLRANLVNTQVLAEIAQDINLGDCIFLGRGAEITGGRARESILADCFEAVLGALYVDKGMEVVRPYVLKKFKKTIIKKAGVRELADFKTSLQEYTSQLLGVMPEYRIFKEEGPVHEKVFFVEVLVEGKVLGKGKGKSKKKAEQDAAKRALKALRESR